MTVREAYDMVEKKHDDGCLIDCWDADGNWMFRFLPYYPIPGVKPPLTGLPVYDVVDKKTGEYSWVQAFSYDLKKKYTPIPVKQFPKGHLYIPPKKAIPHMARLLKGQKIACLMWKTTVSSFIFLFNSCSTPFQGALKKRTAISCTQNLLV